MNSKEDDDTLPLPGLSQLSVDVTVDEDFIPTSQPHSVGSSKTAKTSESSNQIPNEESELLTNSKLLMSLIDDTIAADCLIDQTLDKDRSSDFIPETETKKRKLDHSEEEPLCKKKLPIADSFEKCTEDIFESPANIRWTMDVSKIPESPVLETQSLETPADDAVKNTSVAENGSGKPGIAECVTEILVNDSAETVDLDGSELCSPMKVKKTGKEDSVVLDKTEVKSRSFDSDIIRCGGEETPFDNSSILLLDHGEPSPLPSLNLQKSEPVVNGSNSQRYLQETVSDSQFQVKTSASASTLPIPTDLSEEFSIGESQEVEVPKMGNAIFKKEFQKSSTPKSPREKLSPRSTETKAMNFTLAVTCLVTFETNTKKVLEKHILNVNEVSKPKPKPKPHPRELHQDNASDKRYSTSSSGSVYSDKTGLPFALPKRVSVISDQTDASDSSEDDLSKRIRDNKKAFDRLPWSNEFLVPLKMDELMTIMIESGDSMNSPFCKPSPVKMKNPSIGYSNHLSDVLESSSSECASISNLNTTEPTIEKAKEASEKEESKNESPESEKVPDQVTEEKIEEECETFEEAKKEKRNPEESKEAKDKKQSDAPELREEAEESNQQINEEVSADNQNVDSLELRDGLPVFARWTDKRYYSGVLSGTPKNDRWEVKFYDGNTKTIKEDFVMPCGWLKEGELVFASVDERYFSGQIIGVKPGKEVTYVVELDEERRKVEVKNSDLLLTDVMAGIVREKYKPLVNTPRGKSSEIDFDNVLTGKRLREQKTPLRPAAAAAVANSSSKKKSTAKTKKDDASSIKTSEQNEKTPKDTPRKRKANTKDSSTKIAGLRSENGHLVEDKVISADSQSGAETGETPQRGNKEGRGKAKPRSLSYEGDDKKMTKTSDWLTADGVPIPGPSGVKAKKTGKRKAESSGKRDLKSEESKAPSRGKRNSKTEDATSENGKANSRLVKESPKESDSSEKKRGKRKLNAEAEKEEGEEMEEEMKGKAGSKRGEAVKKKTRTKK